jgi:hypothetical protein
VGKRGHAESKLQKAKELPRTTVQSLRSAANGFALQRFVRSVELIFSGTEVLSSFNQPGQPNLSKRVLCRNYGIVSVLPVIQE